MSLNQSYTVCLHLKKQTNHIEKKEEKKKKNHHQTVFNSNETSFQEEEKVAAAGGSVWLRRQSYAFELLFKIQIILALIVSFETSYLHDLSEQKSGCLRRLFKRLHFACIHFHRSSTQLRYTFFEIFNESIKYHVLINRFKSKLKLFSKYSLVKRFLIVALFLPNVFNFNSNVLAQPADPNTTVIISIDIAPLDTTTITTPQPATTTSANRNEFSSFKIYNCNNNNNEENEVDGTNRLKFDSRLFYELNMHETILNLYKSCFREGLKSSTFDYEDENPDFMGDNKKDYNPNKSDNIEEIMFCKKQKILESILYKMVNTFHDIIGRDVLDRIQLVCRPDTEITTLDKLYLMTSYEHELCGNIFRNSMKKKHLNNDVLKLSLHHQQQLQSNQMKKKQTVKQNFEKRNVFISPITTSLTSNQVETSYSILNSQNSLEFRYLLENHSNFDSKDSQSNHFQFSSAHIIDKRETISRTFNSLNTTFKELNNCTLILLNTYLLAFKSSCDNKDFEASLNHYDCASNNFSVKSNCKLCQEAYSKWLCSTNIPYYENGRLAKPCQRYCFNVQNMCPFFRPMDDNFGAQPLFHCRNVVQVTEERPDGYEDDDEHYYEDEINDDDKCYSECNSDSNDVLIQSDLDLLFKENLPLDSEFKQLTDSFPIHEAWSKLDSALFKMKLPYLYDESLANKTLNPNVRYTKSLECMFNSISSKSAASFSKSVSVIKILLILMVLNIIINE